MSVAMILSAKAEYACLAMLELALRYGDPRPVRLAEIADKHGIPQRFLVQILLLLKGAGLVASTRGASGGYQLARPPESISLADILSVVDRPEGTSTRGEETALAAALHGVLDQVSAARQKILSETSLARLVEEGQGLQYVI